ncbi:MAG: flagellar export chaperone FliS [Ruminococcus sp.]|nr:flagellar export chaperone FliS [Ruminococcus sp.]
MQNNPYQKIMQQSVNTMTPVQLLIALYEKGEIELTKAVYYIENKDVPNAHNSIIKAQKIIQTLDSSLKEKYEVSKSLGSLYDYMYRRLIEANVKKDTEILKEIIPFFRELKETFSEINRRGY